VCIDGFKEINIREEGAQIQEIGGKHNQMQEHDNIQEYIKKRDQKRLMAGKTIDSAGNTGINMSIMVAAVSSASIGVVKQPLKKHPAPAKSADAAYCLLTP